MKTFLELRDKQVAEDYKALAKQYRAEAVKQANRIVSCLQSEHCNAGKYVARQLQDIADELEIGVEGAKEYASRREEVEFEDIEDIQELSTGLKKRYRAKAFKSISNAERTLDKHYDKATKQASDKWKKDMADGVPAQKAHDDAKEYRHNVYRNNPVVKRNERKIKNRFGGLYVASK